MSWSTGVREGPDRVELVSPKLDVVRVSASYE